MSSSQTLADYLRQHRGLVVLTGAGISVASGIPAYRDHAGQWLGSNPIQHSEFLASDSHRRRYWRRSAVGWPRIAAAEPNSAHHALATLEAMGLISLLVTQNVDGLHQRAGQRQLIELHGSLDRVVCVDCGAGVSRAAVQQALIAQAPGLVNAKAEPAPDGDARLADSFAQDLQPPECAVCDGVLMPDVVFFGGAVPRRRVETIRQALDSAPALLVVGSSLMVYSGLRFVRQMGDAGKPVAALNMGATRADDALCCHWRMDAGDALQGAVRALKEA